MRCNEKAWRLQRNSVPTPSYIPSRSLHPFVPLVFRAHPPPPSSSSTNPIPDIPSPRCRPSPPYPLPPPPTTTTNTGHSTDALLLDATFRIASVDQKKYDRVARLTGERDDLTFTLDINCELYPVAVDDTVQLSIASTLSLDGVISGGGGGGTAGGKAAAADAGAKGGWWRGNAGGAAGDEATLADQYDYVCYGKMYRFEEGAGDVMSVLPSCSCLALPLFLGLY